MVFFQSHDPPQREARASTQPAQIALANDIVTDMKHYLRTSSKDPQFAQNAAFIKWLLQEGEVGPNDSVKDLVLGVFFFRWKGKSLSADGLADKFKGTSATNIRAASDYWNRFFEEFWFYHAIGVRYKHESFVVAWPRTEKEKAAGVRMNLDMAYPGNDEVISRMMNTVPVSHTQQDYLIEDDTSHARQQTLPGSQFTAGHEYLLKSSRRVHRHGANTGARRVGMCLLVFVFVVVMIALWTGGIFLLIIPPLGILVIIGLAACCVAFGKWLHREW